MSNRKRKAVPLSLLILLVTSPATAWAQEGSNEIIFPILAHLTDFKANLHLRTVLTLLNTGNREIDLKVETFRNDGSRISIFLGSKADETLPAMVDMKLGAGSFRGLSTWGFDVNGWARVSSTDVGFLATS